MTTKKIKTLLVLGDDKDFDTYCKFIKQIRFFYKSVISVKNIDYFSLLANKFPNITTKEIIVFPCFPFEFWDKYIEPRNYKGVYGHKAFYTKFQKFWRVIEKILKKEYKGKKLYYINDLKKLVLDRDKETVKTTVSKYGISVPKKYSTRKLEDILKLINKGKKLFIKVRFGSMGKGFTYVEKDRWITNFRFKTGKIMSRKSDYGWTFVNYTGKKDFLKELLKQEIIIEEAIDSLLIKNRKFDLRFYVYKNKVLYSYVRTAASDAITTNISQGARGEKAGFVNKLPKNQLQLAKKQAIISIKALGLNFGGVDIMFCSDKKNIRFIEVNTFPGFPKVKRFNLSKYLIKEIISDYS